MKLKLLFRKSLFASALFVTLGLLHTPLHGQTPTNGLSDESTVTLLLWPDRAPFQTSTDFEEVHERTDKLRLRNIHTPTIEVFLPESESPTAAVLLFPGGGYAALVYETAGINYAKWLNKHGIAGIIVKYRLPDWNVQSNAKFVPLADAQRALRMTRFYSDEWNIDPERIGVLGSSAGGHVASSLSTMFDVSVNTGVEDEIQKESARPDFSVLVYPVISMLDPEVHSGSQKRLLGEAPSLEDLNYFSTQKQVHRNVPPTFLIHSTDDKSVPVENSLLYYSALRENEISSTLHIYQDGGHGFGFGKNRGSVENWMDVLLKWMSYNGAL